MPYPEGVNEILPIPGFSDPFSSIVHLVGAVLFLLLCPRLIAAGKQSVGRLIALASFGLSAPLLLATSGVYHALPAGSDDRVLFQRLDHAAIFLLIAGTFTAGHAILFRGKWRGGPITMIWVIAAAGVVLKVFFFEHVSEGVGLIFYLGMGWIGVISGYRVWHLYGPPLFWPLAYGGLAYTAGAILEFCRWPTLVPGVVGPHELFHVCVLLGVGFHWLYVIRFADGKLDGLLHGEPRSDSLPA